MASETLDAKLAEIRANPCSGAFVADAKDVDNEVQEHPITEQIMARLGESILGHGWNTD